MLLLFSVLSAVGLSHLIVDGSIFAGVRGYLVEKYKESHPWVLELISCYQCTGFWTGALVGLLLQPISWGFWLPSWTLTPLLMGFASSYASMAAAAFLNFLDAPMMNVKKDK